MAYRVRLGEVVIECDEIAEAKGLAEAFSGQGRSLKGPLNGKSHVDEGDKFQKFMMELTGAPKLAVESLASADKELTTDELAEKMGLDTQKIKYAMRTIQSTAEKVGILGDVIKSKRTTIDGKPKSFYCLGTKAREALRPK
jgi:hypothetical protein